ncbi:hypothetical protein AMATHDRAFT_153075 [Amanita thiersii Skay4041]|uniref:Uncharacterized protein n=1 Tax=Amanita thiersii Skay4041 TaxID=703135 RepID=A0A2A9NFL9_9AGAR|nr:hypothetical protein AMATHDRAFT_153075 [Amanita thiersii Skay4041]
MENIQPTAAAIGNSVRAPGTSFVRPRASLNREVSGHRESNALRASVLDVAMQLGLGKNSAVADWIFNNPVTEEDEVCCLVVHRNGLGLGLVKSGHTMFCHCRQAFLH